jgi:hypothetical protein
MAFELLINQMSELVFCDDVVSKKKTLPALSNSVSSSIRSSLDDFDRQTPWLSCCVLTDTQLLEKLVESASHRKVLSFVSLKTKKLSLVSASI